MKTLQPRKDKNAPEIVRETAGAKAIGHQPTWVGGVGRHKCTRRKSRSMERVLLRKSF